MDEIAHLILHVY